jgi:hypothetical protein
MSDPVSNHDIEDVLSSIRKLVAQGSHTAKPRGGESPLHAVPTEPVERLVLTPAFRVRDAEDDSPAALKMPPDFSPTEELEAEFVRDEPLFVPENTADSDDILTKVEVGERASLEATIAELEAAVTEISEEWEPDGSEGQLESSVTSAFLHKLDTRQSNSPESAVTEAVAEHIADTVAEEIALGMSSNAANSREEPVAAGDTAEAEIVDEADVEEDVSFSHTRFEEVYDPVAEATADAAEKEIGDVFGDELAPDVDPAFGGVAMPENVQLVDPDALRSLVGEMIRSELQGEMGERITSNVRKLVRREINRVITEQDV